MCPNGANTNQKMNAKEPQISNNIIRQIIILSVILLLTVLIVYNLSAFLPSILGAITLYIISRNLNFKLVEQKKWKPWLSAMFVIASSLVMLIFPMFFIIEMLVDKIGNAQNYAPQLTAFFNKIDSFILSKTGFELMNKENLGKLTTFATRASSSILNSTVNMVTVIGALFFILYFMLVNGRFLEKVLTFASPFKKSNSQKIGEKFRKMVIANAVGIPVVALGQAIVALIAYYIFSAPSPMLLFTLTFVGSMIPIVGAAIIYVPIGLFMLANGDNNGIWLMIYCGVIVGSVDNILRFTFLKKLENIHPLNTIFGIILGLKIFGFLGLIFGPILISMTILLMKIYDDEFNNDHENKMIEDELTETEKFHKQRIEPEV